jgi:hypothetical protein
MSTKVDLTRSEIELLSPSNSASALDIPWYTGILRFQMPRAFNGQIHVRVPAEVHEEVAKEAFDKGTSISGIFAQALIVRRALRGIDPWKSIAEVQRANRSAAATDVTSEVAKAVKAVRKSRRA